MYHEKNRKYFSLITFLGGWGTGTIFCKFFLHCMMEKRERLFAPLAPPRSRFPVAVKRGRGLYVTSSEERFVQQAYRIVAETAG